jgi:hypothetical protein
VGSQGFAGRHTRVPWWAHQCHACATLRALKFVGHDMTLSLLPASSILLPLILGFFWGNEVGQILLFTNIHSFDTCVGLF